MQNRNYGLDIFRIMCCFGVLDYHIMGAFLSGTNAQCGGGVIYFLAAFCVPGFFLLSGYLIGEKKELDIEYIERKVKQVVSKLFGWIVFWTVIHFIKTEEVYDIWSNFVAGALSEGILPVAWFLFTYCFLMMIGYPVILFRKKYKLLFHLVVIIWMCALAMGIGSNIVGSRKQSLWLHLYIGYFGLGIALEQWIRAIMKYQVKVHKILLCTNLFFGAIYIFHVLTAEKYLPPNAYYGKWYYTLWLVSLFWFIATIKIRNNTIQRLTARVSSNTLVVYMAPHIPTLYVLGRIRLESAGMALLLILILFTGSELLAELFRKMPLLRKLV